MPPLFFAVVATSSDARGPTAGGHLALLPGGGGGGWQSARCCSFPQELLLELERGAEIHEVEIATRGEFAPSAVEVHLSRSEIDGDFSPPGGKFELAGTLGFEAEDPSRRVPTARRARLKVLFQCSGQVRLLVHGPVSRGSGNPYMQVSLTTVELWGHSDVVPRRKPPIAATSMGVGSPALSGEPGEIARVLTELGIPLDLVPVDEEEMRFSSADPDTRRLMVELQRRLMSLRKASRLGDAQRLSEHLESLARIGSDLARLIAERGKLLGAGRAAEAGSLDAEVRKLEADRLSIAALLETDWFLESMALPASSPGAPDGAVA